MNGIIFAGNAQEFAGSADRYLRIIAPQKNGSCEIAYSDGISCVCGEIAVIPPFVKCGYATRGEVLLALIEQPLTGLKIPAKSAEVFVGVSFAVRQAEEFSKLGGGGAVLSPLGDLLVGYINFAFGGETKTPVVANLAAQIEKNACDALFSVEDCIRKLPLNYDYVRKLFKKETGVTPHEYLVNLRMERARAIISGGVTNRYGKYSVSQIAEACGFAEPLYFSRVFKKYFGVSPSEYIK